MEVVKCKEWVSRPYPIFENRIDAGKRLSSIVDPFPDLEEIVLCIPRGGVQVGFTLAQNFRAPLRAIPVRKPRIPTSPEAGFGAITVDGTTSLNQRLLNWRSTHTYNRISGFSFRGFHRNPSSTDRPVFT